MAIRIMSAAERCDDGKTGCATSSDGGDKADRRPVCLRLAHVTARLVPCIACKTVN
jgi:hypothetical protein